MQIVSNGDNGDYLHEILYEKSINNLSLAQLSLRVVKVNPCPAEPGYILPLQTV